MVRNCKFCGFGLSLLELGFDYIAGIVVKDKDMVRQGIENGLAFKPLQGVKHVILRANN